MGLIKVGEELVCAHVCACAGPMGGGIERSKGGLGAKGRAPEMSWELTFSYLIGLVVLAGCWGSYRILQAPHAPG